MWGAFGSRARTHCFEKCVVPAVLTQGNVEGGLAREPGPQRSASFGGTARHELSPSGAPFRGRDGGPSRRSRSPTSCSSRRRKRVSRAWSATSSWEASRPPSSPPDGVQGRHGASNRGTGRQRAGRARRISGPWSSTCSWTAAAARRGTACTPRARPTGVVLNPVVGTRLSAARGPRRERETPNTSAPVFWRGAPSGVLASFSFWGHCCRATPPTPEG